MNLKLQRRSGLKKRRGIASVIGTMIFVVVLMLAIGAQTYIGGLQAQSNQASQEAQQVANQRADELLVFSNPTTGLTVVNSGLDSATIVGMYFRYPNGSIYSGSSFSWVYLPASSSALAKNLVPSTVCKDQSGFGSATCLARYNAVTGTTTAGFSVGVLTSLGNTFWYTPAISLVKWSSLTGFPAGCSASQYMTGVGTALTCSQVGWTQLTGYPSPCGSNQYVSAYGSTLTCSQISLPWSQLTGFPSACPAGQFISQLGTTPTCAPAGALTSYLTSNVATSSTLNNYVSTGLSVTLQPNHVYAFFVYTAISAGGSPSDFNFEIHALPAGATLIVACSPMSYPEGGGNQPTQCVTATGTPIAAVNNLGFGVSPPVYATPGIFGTVSMGSTGGTLQIDFATTGIYPPDYIDAGSFMIAYQVA